MSINDIIEDLKFDIQVTQDQINETMDENPESGQKIWITINKNYIIFEIIDHGK